VGSGPGALATAEYAFEAGYDVTIIERSPIAGGLPAVGINELKRKLVEVECYYTRLEEAGVTIVRNTHVNANPVEGKQHRTYQSLVVEFDAVVMAQGKYKPKMPLTAEQGAEHVAQAIDFLYRNNYVYEQRRLGNNDPVVQSEATRLDRPELDAKGKRVFVIGGSDTAADVCNVSAMRQGATRVIHVYRGSEDQMRMDKKEKNTALDAGVNFEYGFETDKVEKLDDGSYKITGKDGRVFEADIVIAATGFDPEDLRATTGIQGLPVNRYGELAVKEGITVKGGGLKNLLHPSSYSAGVVGVFQTASGKMVPLFAAGDIAGGSLAVHALAGGRDLIAGDITIGEEIGMLQRIVGNQKELSNLPVIELSA
jgi:glutamate synthase (NADPH/NADH) small chain